MTSHDLNKFENLKGRTITKKNGRFFYFSSKAGRTLPLKKVIAEALIAGGHCDLNT
jgi:hypothetical protein